jgi:hypothetical protein
MSEYHLEALRRVILDTEAYKLGLKYDMEEFKNNFSHCRVRADEDDVIYGTVYPRCLSTYLRF